MTVMGSLFHSTCVAIVKSILSIVFLGQIAKTDSPFPQVRLLDMIRQAGRCDKSDKDRERFAIMSNSLKFS